MKHLMAATLIAIGAAWFSPSAMAQIGAVKNDLYMGFQNQAANAASDYIINLGPAANIVGGSTVVTLSSDFSITKFNAVIGSSSSLYCGVVGASDADSPSDVYTTQLRSGGAGSPAVAGSTAPPSINRSSDNSTYEQALNNLVSPAAGAGTNDTTKSWENYVEPTFNGNNSFYGATGINPDSLFSTGSILYEDLWETTSSTLSGVKPFVYLGYFTLNLTGSNPVLTFTPLNAPAPLSSPVFQSIVSSAGSMTLIWNTVATHSYQLQYTTSLSPTNWTNIGSSQMASAAFMTNTDTTIGTNTTRFYRLIAQ